MEAAAMIATSSSHLLEFTGLRSHKLKLNSHVTLTLLLCCNQPCYLSCPTLPDVLPFPQVLLNLPRYGSLMLQARDHYLMYRTVGQQL